MLPRSFSQVKKKVCDESGASTKQLMRTFGGPVADATFYFSLRLGLACLIYKHAKWRNSFLLNCQRMETCGVKRRDRNSTAYHLTLYWNTLITCI